MFVKKPIPINATQIKLGGHYPLWIHPYIADNQLWLVGEEHYRVKTNHGLVEAHVGDWILQQVDGEIYPCSDQVFRATYDELPDPVADPAPGSRWIHRNGAPYVVLLVTSMPDDPARIEKYPVTVVYQSEATGKIWPRRLSDWHRSMTPRPPEIVAPE